MFTVFGFFFFFKQKTAYDMRISDWSSDVCSSDLVWNSVMPFIPHSEADVSTMLRAIGVARIEDLFDEIPEALKVGALDRVPEALSEMELARLLAEHARAAEVELCFAGAGAYEHHLPPAVCQNVGMGGFFSAFSTF